MNAKGPHTLNTVLPPVSQIPNPGQPLSSLAPPPSHTTADLNLKPVPRHEHDEQSSELGKIMGH